MYLFMWTACPRQRRLPIFHRRSLKVLLNILLAFSHLLYKIDDIIRICRFTREGELEMQLYLRLFFNGSPWELAEFVISFYRNHNIDHEEIHQEREVITAVSEWFVVWVDLEREQDRFRDYLQEEYQMVLNRNISIQLHPGCDEEMFSQFMAYLLTELEGDLYLWSEWDEEILWRRQHQLFIKKEIWKKYLGIK